MNEDPDDELAAVAAELYGLLPGEFTAARNERVKELRGTDRELSERVRKLPRPSTAAWAVNMLVRHHREEVEQVLQLGAALRGAQRDLDADQLRELNRQRHGVTAAVTRQSRALAKRLGQPVSEAVAVEVEQTLRAAMADAAAAAAVRGGQLTSALSSTGLGPVDLTGAVAVPSAVPPSPPPPAPSGEASPRSREQPQRADRDRKREAERALQQARADAGEAERTLQDAERALEQVRQRTKSLRSDREALGTRLRDLQEEVRQVEREIAERDRQARAADRDEDSAEREVSTARRAADRARQRVERLSRG